MQFTVRVALTPSLSVVMESVSTVMTVPMGCVIRVVIVQMDQMNVDVATVPDIHNIIWSPPPSSGHPGLSTAE